MKKTLAIIALATMSVLTTTTAHAGFYIEPYLGLIVSGEDQDGDKVTGNGFGARVGYSVMGLAFGLDYGLSSTTIEDSTGDSDVDLTDLGAFVSYEFPILFRVYATYILDSQGESGSNEFSGTGMKFGVGYTGLPFVVINLEKYTGTYDELNGNTLSPESEIDATLVSISVPLP